jgi:hypothetical protein
VNDSLNEITRRYVKILNVLSEDGGFTTGEVAKRIQPFGTNARMHSGATRSWLNSLKIMGFVAHLDDRKPVCWVRTRDGTAYMEARIFL